MPHPSAPLVSLPHHQHDSPTRLPAGVVLASRTFVFSQGAGDEALTAWTMWGSALVGQLSLSERALSHYAAGTSSRHAPGATRWCLATYGARARASKPLAHCRMALLAGPRSQHERPARSGRGARRLPRACAAPDPSRHHEVRDALHPRRPRGLHHPRPLSPRRLTTQAHHARASTLVCKALQAIDYTVRGGPLTSAAAPGRWRRRHA